MKRETKLAQKETHEQEAQLGQASQAGREFSSAEDLLRFDASQTEVPPGIGRRLAESTNNTAPESASRPARSWWQRFWGASQ